MASQGARLGASRRVLALPRLLIPGRVTERPPELILGVVLLALITLVTFAGGLVYRASPYTINPASALASPSAHILLGTDQLGRDELARVIAGGKDSLIVGFAASALAIVIGMLYGLSAGLGPKVVDTILMRVLEAPLPQRQVACFFPLFDAAHAGDRAAMVGRP